MSERLRDTAYVVFMTITVVALAALVLAAPDRDDRVEELGSRIRCPVCQGEAIIDSPAPMARDMMDLIRQRVDEGASDEEILFEITSSYSGALLLDPPAEGATLWLWLTPLLALAGGISVILWWRAHPGGGPGSAKSGTSSPHRRRSRAIAGGLLMTLVLGGVVVAAGSALQDREGPGGGAADIATVDPSSVSNETMEAVIAANEDDPRVDGMRLALAERYFSAGDYRSAFPHYLAIAQSGTAPDEAAHTALVRLGWMAYDGNGEVETALALLDQALDIDAGAPMALYLKGLVLWCGADQPEEAGDLFQAVLDHEDLEEEIRTEVFEDLAAARRGEGCA